MGKSHKGVLMREFVIHTGSNKKAEVIPLGDIHYGHKVCDIALLKTMVTYIGKGSNRRWFGVGDFIEGIPANYKIPTWEQDKTPDEQRKEISSILKPIAKKGLFLIDGNHEERILNQTSISPGGLISEMLGMAFHDEPEYIKIIVRSGAGQEQEYLFVVAHGGSAALSNDKEFEDLRKSFPMGDVFCLGHDHRLRVFPGVHFYENVTKKFYCVRCGTYLRYPSYAFKKLLSPNALGSPRIYLSSERYKIEIDVTGDLE